MKKFKVTSTIMLASGGQFRCVNVVYQRGLVPAIQEAVFKHKRQMTADAIKGRSRIIKLDVSVEDQSIEARHEAR